jgi:hypothetical protein
MRPTCWKYAALVFLLFPLVASAAPAPVAFAAGPDVATSFTAASAPSLALSTPFVGGIRYRPRGQYRDDRNWSMPTWTQVHAGFYDPSDNFGTSFNGGIRMGPMVDPHVQLGVGLDWWHRAQSETQDLGSVELPGGSGTAQVELSQSTADLVPLLAFVQVSGDENMPLIPYGGAAVGYEWLVVSADHPDGASFDETFGGLGWQLWGGAALPLSGRTRLNGELFYNYCEPENNDYVTDDGLPVTLKVKMSGVGMRFGLSWGF